MTVGITGTTFRRSVTRAEAVRIAAKGGAECTEWDVSRRVRNEEDARQIKALCDGAGIGIFSLGSYFRVGKTPEREFDGLCRITAAMHGRFIRVWLGDKSSRRTGDAERGRLIDETRGICDIAEEYGLRVTAECHPHTFNDDTDAILRFYDELGRDGFYTCFQSLYRSPEYDRRRIDETFFFTSSVHLSYSECRREQRFAKKDPAYPDRILDVFREKGFAGPILLEFCKGSKEENIIRDLARIREALK